MGRVNVTIGHQPINVVLNEETVEVTVGFPRDVNWGDILGTLADQADLQAALNAKYDASNPDGFISDLTGFTTDDLAEGLSNLYWTQARFNTAFAAKDTDDLSEGGANLYFTNARAITALTGQNVSIFNNDAGYLTSSTGVSSITGTANQVIASSPTGAVTLSLPQNIHTAATPTFSGMTLNGLLTISSGGAFITGSINNNAGGITNTGALAGVTGITTSGGYTQSGATANTFTGATTFSAAGTALSVTNNAKVNGTIQAGPAAAMGTIPNGVGSLFAPQMGNSQTSGVAGFAVGVTDGTNNHRAGLMLDNTNSLWGLVSIGSVSPIPFVIRNGALELLRLSVTGLGLGTTTLTNGFLTIRRSTAGTAIAVRSTDDSASTFTVTAAGVVTGGTYNGQTISSTANFTGTATIATSLSISALTAGSVLYAGASGLISQDNAGLFYDATNDRLSIGTNSHTPLYSNTRLVLSGSPALDGTNPVTLTLASTQNSGSWTAEADLASINFWSDDVSGSGAGVKASISMFTQNAGGSLYGLRMVIADGNGPFTGLQLNPDGRFVTNSSSLTLSDKTFRWGTGHYDNAEEPMQIIVANSTATASALLYGGGNANFNAATVHRFFVAANTTTTTGTEIMRIGTDVNGNPGISLGGQNITPAFNIQGNRTYAASWASNGVGLRIQAMNITDSSGTNPQNAHFCTIAAPTYIAPSALTNTHASTFYISGAPIAGSNYSITNPYALFINDGGARINTTLLVCGDVGPNNATKGMLGGSGTTGIRVQSDGNSKWARLELHQSTTAITSGTDVGGVHWYLQPIASAVEVASITLESTNAAENQGNLKIGTASAGVMGTRLVISPTGLAVTGAISATTGAVITGGITSTSGLVTLERTAVASSYVEILRLSMNGNQADASSGIDWYDASTTLNRNQARITVMRNGSQDDYGITFATRGTTDILEERVRIHWDGDFLIGTTTAGSKLTVKGVGATSAANAFLAQDSANASLLTIRNDGAFAFKGGTVGLAETGWTDSSTNYSALRQLGFDFTSVNADDANFRTLARFVETMMRALKTKGIVLN